MAMRRTRRTATALRTGTPATIRSWDEIDEQMAGEGQATIRSMRSVSQPRRTGQSRETLVPGKAHVPMKGTGAGSAR